MGYPLARFSSVWQKLLSRQKGPLEEILNLVFQDCTQITSKFSKPFPVLPTSSLNSRCSQSAMTQENKIKLLKHQYDLQALVTKRKAKIQSDRENIKI